MKHGLLTSIFIFIASVSLFAQSSDAFRNKFVILLDIQKCYVTNVPDSTTARLIAEANSVISKVDKDRVIYVKSIMKTLSFSFRGVRVDTVPNHQFCEGLNIVNSNIFIKEDSNAFKTKRIENFLRSRDAKDIIVIGLTAEQCVSSTALGGLALGYNMYLVPSAIIGKSKEGKANAIDQMKSKGVLILTDE